MQQDINNTLLKNCSVRNILIPNPHNIEAIKKLSCETVEDYTFDKNNKYLITAGRLMNSKRLDILLSAFSEVNRIRQNCRLIILGDGEDMGYLKQLCYDMNIQDKVFFAGHVVNPHKYIARSDIFVLTSEREGLPNILIEAMICRTPVISTDCLTGPREILAPQTDFNKQLQKGIEISENGILIPVNAVKELTEAVKIILEDNDLGSKLVANGSVFIQRFTPERIIVEYEKILV